MPSDAEKASKLGDVKISSELVHIELYEEEMSLVNDANIVVEGNLNEFDQQELEDLLTNERRVGPGAEVTKITLSKDSRRATVSFKEAKSKELP